MASRSSISWANESAVAQELRRSSERMLLWLVLFALVLFSS